MRAGAASLMLSENDVLGYKLFGTCRVGRPGCSGGAPGFSEEVPTRQCYDRQGRRRGLVTPAVNRAPSTWGDAGLPKAPCLRFEPQIAELGLPDDSASVGQGLQQGSEWGLGVREHSALENAG